MTELDRSHDPAAGSWVAQANGHADFPVQNLPLAIFRRAGTQEAWRGGVAIGDQVLDLGALSAGDGLADAGDLARGAFAACSGPRLNELFALGPPAWRALRLALFDALQADAPASRQALLGACLMPQAQAEFALPAKVGDYTDFYTSLDHALNIGRLYRPDDPLAPNFRWMPIAYHGRASSLIVSGTAVRRPRGQWLAQGDAVPVFAACEKLDYELELAIWVGTGNTQGAPIPIERAEQHVFGIGLLNDWSARDIQRWESTPLGPFQSKNFATTVSPWIVTMDALAPYRLPALRAAGEPAALPHLDDARQRAEGALDIRLEVLLQSAAMAEAGRGAVRLSQTSFRHQYWTVAQMVAHHTASGCNLQAGDLLGSGTISGPGPGEAGALIELSRGGQAPVALDGAGTDAAETRAFLADGDTVTLRGWCERPGRARIGFGQATGTVLPAA